MSGNSGLAVVRPWVSLIVRVSMGLIMIWGGVSKMLDLPASVRAVRAYRVVPETFVPFLGHVIPFLEILLGIILILGLLTRWAALTYLAVILVYLGAFLWAWYKGYKIDCGCFGGGGDLAAGVDPGYVSHLLERLAFLALGAWLAIYPASRFSVDGWLKSTT